MKSANDKFKGGEAKGDSEEGNKVVRKEEEKRGKKEGVCRNWQSLNFWRTWIFLVSTLPPLSWSGRIRCLARLYPIFLFFFF